MGTETFIEATWALSLAIVLVLLLRNPVRRGFGASAAYALWAAVPLALLAGFLPAPARPMAPLLATLVTTPETTAPVMTAPAVGMSLASLLPWLWAAGSLVMLLWMLRQQQLFLAGLGPLSARPDGHFQCVATRGLPAVVGLRPKIVLPGDFEQRYGPIERELVLAHESVHVRRGDLLACLLVFVLRGLFWFNPLMHWAAARFRQDQELACDAAVLRRYPSHRRLYGDAMLKTRLAGEPLPLGCHWSAFHPMKERLAMLKNPLPSRRRHLAGLCLALLTALFTAAAAWAGQTTQAGDGITLAPGQMRLEMQFKIDDDEQFAHDAKVVIRPEEPHREAFTHAGVAWDSVWTVTPLADGTFDIRAVIQRDGDVVGEPRLIARDEAAIGIGEQRDDGRFEGVAIELSVVMGPPAEGMAAVGIEGNVPAYPKAAANAGEGGLVMLRVLVGVDGKPQEIEFDAAKSSVPVDSALIKSTMDAAAGWTFQPQLMDGKAVPGWVMVPVRFEPPTVDQAGTPTPEGV